jgi:hypothetical protein
MGSVTRVGLFVCVDNVQCAIAMCNEDMLTVLRGNLQTPTSQHTLEYRYSQHIFIELISNVICVLINKLPISSQNRVCILSRFCQEEVEDIFSFRM